MTKPKLFRKSIKLERVYPENLHSHFVSNIVVQHEPDSFILSFFEVWPPAIIGGDEEEKQKELEKINRVEAKCVARLVVTPKKMADFVKAMTENLKTYETMIQTKELFDENK